MKYLVVFLLTGISLTSQCQDSKEVILNKNFKGNQSFYFVMESGKKGDSAGLVTLIKSEYGLLVNNGEKMIARLSYDSAKLKGDVIEFSSFVQLWNSADSVVNSVFKFKTDGSLQQFSIDLGLEKLLSDNGGKGWHCTNHHPTIHRCPTFPAFASPSCATDTCKWTKDK